MSENPLDPHDPINQKDPSLKPISEKSFDHFFSQKYGTKKSKKSFRVTKDIEDFVSISGELSKPAGFELWGAVTPRTELIKALTPEREEIRSRLLKHFNEALDALDGDEIKIIGELLIKAKDQNANPVRYSDSDHTKIEYAWDEVYYINSLELMESGSDPDESCLPTATEIIKYLQSKELEPVHKSSKDKNNRRRRVQAILEELNLPYKRGKQGRPSR